MAEGDRVELVDDTGIVIGESTVAQAHQPPGQRHRAFSVVAHDGAGSVLLQQRAAVKTRFPLRWGNTCCGHPLPGESAADAARRRTAEELGLTFGEIESAGPYVYDAPDPDSGMVECEYDEVLLAQIAAQTALRPDLAEVAQTAWLDLDQVLANPANLPGEPAPWLLGVLRLAQRRLLAG